MRELIVAVGSRGDVAPFAGVGQRLRVPRHRRAAGMVARIVGLDDGAVVEAVAALGDR